MNNTGKEKNDDSVVIIVSLLHHPVATQGRVCECAMCRKEAWLSDSSIDAVKENSPNIPVRLICMNCFGLMQEKEQEIKFQNFTKAQLAEIRSSIR